MSRALMTQGIAEASRFKVPDFRAPAFRAKLAGALYFFSLLTAASDESLLRGRLRIAAGLIAVAGMAVMTVLLYDIYDIFKPVSPSVSLLAVLFAFMGLTLETVRLQPQGLNIALVFHGFYCILIGYLIFKSTFLPRILGALMGFAGLGWLTYLSNPLANHLSPCFLASGLLGDVSVFLWLLVMGVNAQHWTEQANWRSQRAFD
jgi:Domain of unknown function (DUF4386)